MSKKETDLRLELEGKLRRRYIELLFVGEENSSGSERISL